MFFFIKKMTANGLAHLPPILAEQESLKITFSTKAPQHTHAEGGQVHAVLGRSFSLSSLLW